MHTLYFVSTHCAWSCIQLLGTISCHLREMVLNFQLNCKTHQKPNPMFPITSVTLSTHNVLKLWSHIDITSWCYCVAPCQSPTSGICLTGAGRLECCLWRMRLLGRSRGMLWYFPCWGRPGPLRPFSRGLGVELSVLSVRADVYKVDLDTQREIL